MAGGSDEDKTEEPTARKLSKAREEGQVARSTELPAAAVTIAALGMLYLTGDWLIKKLAEAFVSGFHFDRKLVHSPNLLPAIFGHEMLEAFILIAPLMVLTAVVAIAASGATGGFLFASKAIKPKTDKLNPLNGIKRMFGTRAWVELGKALLKFALVAGVVAYVLYDNISTLNAIGRMSFEPGIAVAGKLLSKSALIMACSLIVIAMIDVPFQRWQFMKQMRMSKQEIKDEMKDMEGRPEVKAQIKRRQREMANGRMIDRVKDADVVITTRSTSPSRCRMIRTATARPSCWPRARTRSPPASVKRRPNTASRSSVPRRWRVRCSTPPRSSIRCPKTCTMRSPR